MLSEPAVGTAFFGREDVLQVLKKRVNALKQGYRQNIALTGQMLSGKSSILYQFLYSLKDASIVPIYIEAVKEKFSSFVDRFIATLLYNYLVSCGHEVTKNLENLIIKAESAIPKTACAIKIVKQEVLKRRYSEAYRSLLGLTSILKKESGKSCVVIFDEFHNLESLKIKNPYLHFGKIIMIQKDTMYIVSSSQRSTFKKILSEKLALLYGNFEVVEISGFDDKTARDFLKEKFNSITLPEALTGYLIAFTEGNPFYLEVISKKMIELANSKKIFEITEEILIKSFMALIYQTSGTINQYFTNNIMTLIEKDLRKNYLDILIALASGSKKLGELAKWFTKKNRAGFTKKLAHLAEIDMVYKNGVFYELHDCVFKFWLRTVYHKKATSLVDDVVARAREFAGDVRGDLKNYLYENEKNTSLRISELFSVFNGEMVEMDKKQRKLPKFMKIEKLDYERCEDIIGYQAHNRYWVSCVSSDRVSETTISEFMKRYHSKRPEVSRRICVALKGIDQNALLLAKEKNIWIWDINNINELLQLYNRYRLVEKQ